MNSAAVAGGSGLHAAAVACALLAVSGCAPLAAQESRADVSSLGCMRSALVDHSFERRSDAEAHCLAAGLIAWRCSVSESTLAGLGKEFTDLFGAGDASWEDLRANRRGVACARHAQTAGDIEQCCRAE